MNLEWRAIGSQASCLWVRATPSASDPLAQRDVNTGWRVTHTYTERHSWSVFNTRTWGGIGRFDSFAEAKQYAETTYILESSNGT